MNHLEKIAAEIAIAVPEKQGRHTSSAKVPWVVIDALRAELERRGFDWKTGHKAYLEIIDERRDRQLEEERVMRADMEAGVLRRADEEDRARASR